MSSPMSLHYGIMEALGMERSTQTTHKRTPTADVTLHHTLISVSQYQHCAHQWQGCTAVITEPLGLERSSEIPVSYHNHPPVSTDHVPKHGGVGSSTGPIASPVHLWCPLLPSALFQHKVAFSSRSSQLFLDLIKNTAKAAVN